MDVVMNNTDAPVKRVKVVKPTGNLQRVTYPGGAAEIIEDIRSAIRRVRLKGETPDTILVDEEYLPYAQTFLLQDAERLAAQMILRVGI